MEKWLLPYQGKYNVRLRHLFGHKGRSGQGMIGIYQKDTDLFPLMVGTLQLSNPLKVTIACPGQNT